MIDTLLKQMPSEVQLLQLLKAITAHTSGVPIVFPVQPRTAERMKEMGELPQMHYVEPLGYREFNCLERLLF